MTTDKLDTLLVASTFLTVDGECNAEGPGVWSYFIRLQGCDVGCSWCDTRHTWSWKRGEEMTVRQLRDAAFRSDAFKVTLTGGEPLQQYLDPRRQATFRELLRVLNADGFRVSIETAGVFPFAELVGCANLIVDWKLKSALLRKKQDRYHPVRSDYLLLKQDDCIKAVVSSLPELWDVCESFVALRRDGCKARMYIGPSHGILEAGELFHQMRENKTFRLHDIRINMQMHKYMLENHRDEELPVGADEEG